MAWAKSVTSFLAQRAQKAGKLGTGVADRKRQAKMALGGAAAARHAEKYIERDSSPRGRCVSAQIANGHIPADLTDDERAYFFDN
jgi:hypothetical protein